MTHVVILGAGLAGLRSANVLANQGIYLSLLERASVAGGRIRAISARNKQERINWGQHLMMGAFHRMLAFAEELGTRHDLQTVLQPTPFVTADGREHAYRASTLPAPFHGLPGLVNLTHLSKRERLGLGLVLVGAKLQSRLQADTLDQRTAYTWLRSLGQSDHVCRVFWEPFTVATLNTPLEEASALLLATVIHRALGSRSEDALPMLPRTTYSDLYVKPMLDHAPENLSIHLNSTVQWIHQDGPDHFTLGLSDNNTMHADAVVSTLAPWDLAKLLSHEQSNLRLPLSMERFVPSPIISVELWYDQAWFKHPYAGLVDADSQWVFRHPSHWTGAAQRLSVVISAAEFLDVQGRELAEHIHQELCSRFPSCRNAGLVDFMVLHDSHATLRQPAGLEAYRPSTRTVIPGFYLAGDWTRTGLPATMESAVQSGETAAQALIEDRVQRVVEVHP